MSCAYREGSPEIIKSRDSWWTSVFASKAAIRIVYIIKNSGITPNQVTIISFLVGVAAAACFGSGARPMLIAGAILLQLSLVLDCVDGQLARLKNQSSEKGAWLDLATDIIKVFSVYFGLSYGAAHVKGDYSFFAWGFCAYFLSVSTMFLFYARPVKIKEEGNDSCGEAGGRSAVEYIYNIIRKRAYYLSFSTPDQYLVISMFAILGIVNVLIKVVVFWGGAVLLFSLARTWRRLSKSNV